VFPLLDDPATEEHHDGGAEIDGLAPNPPPITDFSTDVSDVV